MTSSLQALRALTDEERLDARDRALAVVRRAEGEKPRRDQFSHVTASRYPGWLTWTVGVLMLVVFIAAAMPSLFRLFTAGRDHFQATINAPLQPEIVGVTTFLLAEFLIILSTIAARVYFDGHARKAFIIPIALGLAMAVVGNYVVARPSLNPFDVFAWLETLAPPLAVLFIALIGERLILDAIETRHANERAYQEAVVQWQLATAEPELSPRWNSAYANALKAVLRDVNGRGTGSTARREFMSTMTAQDWRPVVMRELQAENWFADLDTVQVEQPHAEAVAIPVAIPANPTQVPVQVETVNGNGRANGHN